MATPTANRVRTINDGSSSTDYLYDAQGLLGVQRGPQGETAFVNDWYQFRNDGWTWKQIWADDDRIAQATEKVDPTTGTLTPFRYYAHADLQGSTNIVTDAAGLVFEHDEYFPSGEMWIQESSTTHRTPYRYVGALNDEVRNLDLMGQRWYQPREQVFYSPEPMLYDDPQATIDDPGLLPAYTYAESNGLRLYDDNADDGIMPTSLAVRTQVGRRYDSAAATGHNSQSSGAHRAPPITPSPASRCRTSRRWFANSKTATSRSSTTVKGRCRPPATLRRSAQRAGRGSATRTATLSDFARHSYPGKFKSQLPCAAAIQRSTHCTTFNSSTPAGGG